MMTNVYIYIFTHLRTNLIHPELFLHHLISRVHTSDLKSAMLDLHCGGKSFKSGLSKNTIFN